MSNAPSAISGGTAHVLPAERAKASFSIKGLQDVVVGGRTERIKSFQPLFDSPSFDYSMDHYMSYPALFAKQIERAAEAMKIIRANPKLKIMHQAMKVNMADFFDTGALGIHFIAFLPFLKTQASAEQKKKWLSGAVNAKYFGAYAQTELGHGSNVRALETTATYDKDTDEFVIHSPTLTSMKWWPTAMYSCTHGVVFARLIIDGHDHGISPFFMQFRDDKGMLMPGVEIGEIGPKLDPKGGSIGYGRFHHVRIPRFNMFAKYAKVTKDGKFIAAPPKLSKFKYFGMMTIRSGMVLGASSVLGRAATIAIRYSCVRKQGFRNTKSKNAISGGENAIIDYKMQQYRLFKALGVAYMFLWNGRYIGDYLIRVRTGIAQGDDSAADDLPELHATCAGLKAVCTTWAADMVEDCRRCCGGQGFLRASGICDLSASSVMTVTAEGEVVILALQTARFLIKSVNNVKAGRTVVGTMTYLSEPPLERLNLTTYAGKANIMLDLLRDRARNVAFQIHEDFTAATKKGMSFDQALNSVAVLAWHASECHCVYIMARNTVAALEKYITSAPTRLALSRLFELNMLQIIRESAADWIDCLNSVQLRLILRRINELLDEIRPDAVAISDGFGWLDHHLKSTIGRYDGNVYEAIYAAAKRNPLNVKRMVGWEKLGPQMDLDFIRKEMQKQRTGSKL